jgi:hypothetical protein
MSLQDRKCMDNETLRRVHLTTVTVWKVLSIKYFERVSLFLHLICACAALYCHLGHVRLYYTFPHKRHDLRIKLLSTKCVFSLSILIFGWNISHSNKNSARYYYNVRRSRRKVPVVVKSLAKIQISRQTVEKYSNVRSSRQIRTVGVEMLDEDGRTDKHDEASSHFSQFCERA